MINVVPRYGPYDDRQKEFVNDIRELIVPSIAGLGEHEAYVGGSTAQFMDFSDKLYGRFPFLVGAVLLLTFFILMMFFQSVFLPLKAILMNLVSILATYGALVLIFQHGWGANLFGFEPVGASRGHAGHAVRDPLQPVDRLRGVHALAGEGVLPRDARQRRGGRVRVCSTRPASSPPPG